MSSGCSKDYLKRLPPRLRGVAHSKVSLEPFQRLAESRDTVSRRAPQSAKSPIAASFFEKETCRRSPQSGDPPLFCLASESFLKRNFHKNCCEATFGLCALRSAKKKRVIGLQAVFGDENIFACFKGEPRRGFSLFSSHAMKIHPLLRFL